MSMDTYTSLDPDHPYRDPDHPGNSEACRSGGMCIEAGCMEPAGTWWSTLWCFAHNVERMDNIGAQFDRLRDTLP